MNLLRACFRPGSEGFSRTGSDAGGRQDGLLWYKDSGQHLNGEFSMAVIQANNLLEDQSQIESGSLSSNESGPYGTFIGIYDGHGGPETSRFINDHLFHHLKSKFTAKSIINSSSFSVALPYFSLLSSSKTLLVNSSLFCCSVCQKLW